MAAKGSGIFYRKCLTGTRRGRCTFQTTINLETVRVHVMHRVAEYVGRPQNLQTTPLSPHCSHIFSHILLDMPCLSISLYGRHLRTIPEVRDSFSAVLPRLPTEVPPPLSRIQVHRGEVASISYVVWLSNFGAPLKMHPSGNSPPDYSDSGVQGRDRLMGH